MKIITRNNISLFLTYNLRLWKVYILRLLSNNMGNTICTPLLPIKLFIFLLANDKTLIHKLSFFFKCLVSEAYRFIRLNLIKSNCLVWSSRETFSMNFSHLVCFSTYLYFALLHPSLSFNSRKRMSCKFFGLFASRTAWFCLLWLDQNL